MNWGALQLRAMAVLGRIGISGAVIALLAVALLGQTIRLEGLRLWPLSIEGWKPRAQRLDRDLANVAAAQLLAQEAQLQLNRQAEAKYAALAKRIDDHAELDRSRELAAADRYIAAHRVLAPTAGRPSGGAGAGAADRGSGSGETLHRAAELDGTDAVRDGDQVAVSAADVRICTINTLQAEAARAWAEALEAASAAGKSD